MDLARTSGAKADRMNPDKPFTFAGKAYLPGSEEEFKEYVDQGVHPTIHDGYAAGWLG